MSVTLRRESQLGAILSDRESGELSNLGDGGGRWSRGIAGLWGILYSSGEPKKREEKQRRACNRAKPVMTHGRAITCSVTFTARDATRRVEHAHTNPALVCSSLLHPRRPPAMSATVQPYSCDACPKSFNTAIGLGQHNKTCPGRIQAAARLLTKRKADLDAAEERKRMRVEELEGEGAGEGEGEMEGERGDDVDEVR